MISNQVVSSGVDGFDIIIVPTRGPGQNTIMMQELLMGSLDWESYVVVRLSDAADKVDSQVPEVRRSSQELLRQELSGVSYLGLKAAILSLRGADHANLARLINQYLSGEPRFSLYNFHVWLEVTGDSWHSWNSFRLFTDSSNRNGCMLIIS